jgi:ADP-heptose:LPS heptosyltransferase
MDVIRPFTKVTVSIANLCLSLVTCFLYRFKPQVNPKSILVFRSSRLGDFICAIPAFTLLRKRYPKAHIALLTFASLNPANWKRGDVPVWVELCRGQFDEIIAFSGPEIAYLEAMKNLRQRIRNLDPDLCFILPFSWEGTVSKLKKLLFLRYLGVNRNVFGWRVRRARLFKVASFRYGDNVHEVLAPLEALQEYKLVGHCEEGEIEFAITTDERDRSFVEKIWKEYGLADRHVIAVFPGGAFEHKRWPIANFQTLCRLLLTSYPVHIVVIGGPNEQELGEELRGICPQRIFNLVAKTSLGQTVEILRRSDLFIGNDSGPAHLATAVGTKCVTLFSSIEFPGSWEPWNSRETSMRHSVPCEFCFSFDHCPTGTMACIRGITVEEVFRTCEQVLNKQRVPSYEHLAD